MALITIPVSEFPALLSIVAFSDAEFSALAKVLEEIPASLSRKKYVENLSGKFPALKPDQANLLLAAIFGMYSAKEKSKLSVSGMAEVIATAASESAEYGSAFSGGKAELLKSRVSQLLSIGKSFALTLKAADILTEVDNVFCGSRILSDIRPVFMDSPEIAAAAIILHNLQISFHHLGKHQEFYVTLEEGELQQLRDTIDRAQAKNAALKSIIAKAELRPL
ncbi:MAG TPA: hypothetical protein VIW67_22255 [Terriglobales bacterium]|jgi:hypothetical protein